MIVRFGYVAMSTVIENASPSRTMTYAQFSKLDDREAALRKLERIAQENLHNTLRLLRHNKASGIEVYRFSSRLIPLVSHAALADWKPFPALREHFAAIGDFVRAQGMRVSFHPDHFTVLSTPRPEVLRSSIQDLELHVGMLEAMGLDETAKCNIHIGGAYGNKPESMERFIRQFGELPAKIQVRMTLENDDKTFTALETLEACETLGVPMVLDIHHHSVNHNGEDCVLLWPRIRETWRKAAISERGLRLPPKIHASSPKSDKDVRSHADYVSLDTLLAFLRPIAADTPALDVMIEAKRKDGALFELMRELAVRALDSGEGLRIAGEASVEIEG